MYYVKARECDILSPSPRSWTKCPRCSRGGMCKGWSGRHLWHKKLYSPQPIIFHHSPASPVSPPPLLPCTPPLERWVRDYLNRYHHHGTEFPRLGPGQGWTKTASSNTIGPLHAHTRAIITL